MDDDFGEVSHGHLVIEFSGEVFEWRGPAPFHFVRVPEDVAEEIGEEAARISYGWGMIPGVLTLAAPAGTPRCGPRTAATWCR